MPAQQKVDFSGVINEPCSFARRVVFNTDIYALFQETRVSYILDVFNAA
jgi:hypothetical protein